MELSQLIQSAKKTLKITLDERPDDQNLAIAIEIFTSCRVELRDPPSPKLDNQICRAWNEAIPRDFREHAQPSGCHKGTLFVSVDSDSWLKEIVRYRRREFLAVMQAKIGADVIQKVSYRVAERGGSTEMVFHLPSGLFEVSQVQHNPSYFGHAQNCVSLAIKHVLQRDDFDVQFCKVAEANDEEPGAAASPQTGHSVELHLETLQSDLEKTLMPFDATSVHGESLHSLALKLSDRFRKGGARWWAAFKRAETARDPLAGELRALGNFWYALANSCDAIAGKIPEETRQIVCGLSRFKFDSQEPPAITFQAAEIQLDGARIAIVVVRSQIIKSQDEAKMFQSHFMDYFEGAHIVLAAQVGDAVDYYGRKDIAERLAEMDPSEIPWREYPISLD